ncbi:MAG: Ig-like domain-containing protein [Terriglobales bacterium]|jgi:hypothetical protein
MRNCSRPGRSWNQNSMRCLAAAAFLFGLVIPAFAQTTPTIALASSVNPGINGSPVTFTATIAGTVGSPPPVPTGTVTFLDGTTALYSPVKLNSSGMAVFTISTLSAATHSITASYSGDGNYLPVTSTVLSEVVVPAPASDYTLTAPVLTQTVEVGTSTSYSVTITPTNGYNGTITFACIGLQGASCAFNPSSLTPNNIETTLVSNLTVTTSIATSALRPPTRPASRSYSLLAGIAGGGFFGIVLLIRSGKNDRRRLRNSRRMMYVGVLAVFAFTLILFLAACGGSSTTGTNTPIGTQNFTVNATGTAGTNGGNTSVHQLNLTLIVTTDTN